MLGMNKSHEKRQITDAAEVLNEGSLELPKIASSGRIREAMGMEDVAIEFGAIARTTDVIEEFANAWQDERAVSELFEQSTAFSVHVRTKDDTKWESLRING